MKIIWWLAGAGCLMVSVTLAVAGSPEDLNGLYAGSADPSAPVLRMADGSTNHLGARAGDWIPAMDGAGAWLSSNRSTRLSEWKGSPVVVRA